MHTERPLSPHLQIYRLPLTAWLSILHRATGALLFLGAGMLTVALFIFSTGEEHWRAVEEILSGWPGILFLTGLNFALYYHLCNGIRHLVWDAGYGLDYKQAYRHGIIMVLIALALSLLTSFLALG
jgi:succinate dehydrogenase / fumarate reductase cytochrome b subunit